MSPTNPLGANCHTGQQAKLNQALFGFPVLDEKFSAALRGSATLMFEMDALVLNFQQFVQVINKLTKNCRVLLNRNTLTEVFHQLSFDIGHKENLNKLRWRDCRKNISAKVRQPKEC